MLFNKKTESEYVLFAVFFVGVVVAIYYIMSIMTTTTNPAEIIEKMVLVSVILSILIILVIVLYKEMDLRDQVKTLIDSGPAEKKKTVVTAKDIKNDLMRIYMDMGALKIIMNDGVIEKNAYNKEIKSLEKRIDILKKEHDKLAK